MAEDWELLELVKRQLGYKWCDQDMINSISEQIEDGKAFLNRFALIPDFKADPYARSLLVSYVRYARAGALDDFRANYRTDLLSLSDHGRVGRKGEGDA